jgi:hypothetical protein
MVVLVGAIAFAQVGIEHTSSRASAGEVEARHTSTAVDEARVALPLPRTVAMAPRDEGRLAAARRSAARTSRGAAADGGRSAGDGVWAALARCESGGDPTARGGGGRYFGAFQFSLATWQSLGYAGNPIDHPYAVQLAAARRLQARSGWDQWPRCSRQLGLR